MQAVLGREQACRDAGRGVDLRVDVLDVVARRLRRDHELARRSACSTGRARPAAGRRPRGSSARPASRRGGRRECPAAARTASTASASSLPALTSACELLGRVLRAERWTVRTRLAHRLVRVDGAEDPCRPRDRRAREPRRVARAVESLAVLDGDRRRAARAPTTDAASARSDTGASRTRSHSPTPSGPGLSQIAFDTPSRPRSCTSPARRSSRASSSRSPSCAAVAAASSATARAWPSVYGDLRSTKSAIASSASSNASSESVTRSGGSASITASHVVRGVELAEDPVRIGAQRSRERRRVELRARRAARPARAPHRRRRAGAPPR